MISSPAELLTSGSLIRGQRAEQALLQAGFVSNGSLTGVGFLRVKGDAYVVLPKAYANRSLPGPIGSVFLLLRLLRRVQFRDQSAASGKQTVRVGNSPYPSEWAIEPPAESAVASLIDMARWLRRDLAANGLYVRRRAAPIRNDFRYPVNWPRTLNASLPILERGGMHFSETRHAGRAMDCAHPLRQIQTEALRQLSGLLGDSDPVRDEPPLINGLSARLALNPAGLFRQLRGELFDERAQELLVALERFFDASGRFKEDSEAPDEFSLWTPNFEVIWETVVRQVLAPADRPRLPCGEWHDVLSGRVDGIQPEIDGFCHVAGKGFLFDAKDKREKALDAGKQTRWLGSANDHYKQMIYAQLWPFNDARQGLRIDYNILVFPSAEFDLATDGSPNLFRIRGRHVWKEQPQSCVWEVEANFELLVKAWLGEARLDVAEALRKLSVELDAFEARASSKLVTPSVA